jgi:hypothetical protein
MKNDSDESNANLPSNDKKNWRFAKWGAAMIFLSFIVLGIGIYLMMKLSAKVVFFRETSGWLMVWGTSLVVWNIYINYFRKRPK